jgi:chemotaxis family two-component system response regulator PixG
MFVKETPYFVSLNLFTASKPIRFLQTLKPLKFSGQLILTDSKEQQWSFYLYQGCIMYATGGVHPIRRWQRQLVKACNSIPAYGTELQYDLLLVNAADANTCWEYQLLCLWVVQQKVTQQQAEKIINGVIDEILFDVAQAKSVVCQINPEKLLSTQLVMVDVQEAITKIHQVWQGWQNAQLSSYSPNYAPVIKQPEKLQKRTSRAVYHTLTQQLNGQQTLRDLALHMNRDVLQVSHALIPYIHLALIELVPIADSPAPLLPPVSKIPVTPIEHTRKIVACIDDSPLVCQTMESLLTAAGYQFIGINDDMKAFSMLISSKPDLIFLDLVMPNTNGYEICSQLRKISLFHNTPILILTGNDGIVDRVRAKLVGATDFLSKPVDADKVLSLIPKYLNSEITLP